MMVQRFDKFPIPATKTPEGFVQDSPVIGRIGILEYYNADGTIRREYRPPEEAFAPESLASLRGKPITIGHRGLVKANNVDVIKPIGTVLSEGKQDGDNIRADLVIYNLSTKNRELSCGYNTNLDETPGEINGQRYDAIQRDIRYNHVGVVSRGRAGSVARLNMDSEQENEDEGEEKPMAKIRLDNGLEYEAAPEVIAAFEKLKADSIDLEQAKKNAIEGAAKAATEAKTKQDQIEAERDTLQAEKLKFDEQLKAKDKEHADGLNAAVAQRVSLLSVAALHKIEKADSMTDKEIKLAVIKSVRSDGADLSGKSDDYISAAFDFCKEDTKKRNDGIESQRKAFGAKSVEKDDGKAVCAKDAAASMKERMENAFKKEGK